MRHAGRNNQMVQAMCENLFNYLESFAVVLSEKNIVSGALTHLENQRIVPEKKLETWFQQFQRQLQSDPEFWKK